MEKNIQIDNNKENLKNGETVISDEGVITFTNYFWRSDYLMNIMNEIGFKNVYRKELYLIHGDAEEYCKEWINRNRAYFLFGSKMFN